MRQFACAVAWLAVLSTARAQTFEPAPSYDVLVTFSDGSGSQAGTATIKPLSDTTYEFEWHMLGYIIMGFGLRSNDILAVSYTWDTSPGMLIYKINGATLDGVFALKGVATGMERLTPKK
jgi:hypothetical protein